MKWVLLAAFAATVSAADFYVAPYGNDASAGTEDAPFATLDRARAAVRELKQRSSDRTDSIVVLMRGGAYYLTAPLTFTAADSGTAALPIVYAAYPGETPVISGGVAISGWQETRPGVWTANLPASTANFEQLFVNDQRRYRPRTTKSGYLHNAGPVYVSAQETGCPLLAAGKGYMCFDRFRYQPGDLRPSYYAMNDVEILDFEKWNMPRLRLKSIDDVNHIAFTTGSTVPDLLNHGFIQGHRYLVENAREALSDPGEWYLDRGAAPWTLTYLTMPGEDLSAATVVAAQLPRVVVATGLQFVTFQGLSFAHDNWVTPAAGLPSLQGEPAVTAAVSFTNSASVTIDSCSIAHTAGWGVEFIGGQSNSIVNSAIYDIGTGGIRLGTVVVPTSTEASVAQKSLIANNVVAGGGRVVADGVGIWLGDAHDNVVTHNDVYDWYHSGIEVCRPSGAVGCQHAHDNEISFNHIWQIGQGVTSDMGGIYVATYPSKNTQVLNNRIHDVTHPVQDTDGYGGEGIYLDNQTSNATLRNNLIYRTSQASVFNNLGIENTITNNIFAYANQGTVQRGVLMLEGLSFSFTRNVALAPVGLLRQSNWICTTIAGAAVPCPNVFLFDSNLYWNPSGAAPTFQVNRSPQAPGQFTNLSLTQWQALGEDTHSMVADPQFVNPTWPADDFRFQEGSPATQIGFVLFDPGQAGRTDPVLYPPPLDPAWTLQLLDPVKDYHQPATPME